MEWNGYFVWGMDVQTRFIASCNETRGIASLLRSKTYVGNYNLSCNGGNNGEIDVLITGGTSPYTLVWNNNSTANQLLNLAAYLRSFIYIRGIFIKTPNQFNRYPDYVFENNYPLMSLDSLSSFVQKEKHL